MEDLWEGVGFSQFRCGNGEIGASRRDPGGGNVKAGLLDSQGHQREEPGYLIREEAERRWWKELEVI